MLKVAVVGATGYTGVELIRLLLRHPEVEITELTSRQYAGENIAKIFPSLEGLINKCCSDLGLKQMGAKADVVFTALPHKTAMEVVPDLLACGCKVIDLSADYRLHDVDVYEKWYQKHTSPDLIKQAAYGMPELYRNCIAEAQLVANPGCYPTSIAIALAPVLREKLIDPQTLIIDSKSGATGAGRSAKTSSLFCEVNEGFKAYAVASHRHTPEIEQTLSDISGQNIQVNFTPHLLPVNRGILSTCYASVKTGTTREQIEDAFKSSYAAEPFVRVLEGSSMPNTAYIQGSNYVDLGWILDERTGRLIIVSAIDNLVKGAAGQALQNMNIICGLDETTGLDIVPLFP